MFWVRHTVPRDSKLSPQCGVNGIGIRVGPQKGAKAWETEQSTEAENARLKHPRPMDNQKPFSQPETGILSIQTCCFVSGLCMKATEADFVQLVGNWLAISSFAACALRFFPTRSGTKT